MEGPDAWVVLRELDDEEAIASSTRTRYELNITDLSIGRVDDSTVPSSSTHCQDVEVVTC